jgi:hypothetical protein
MALNNLPNVILDKDPEFGPRQSSTKGSTLKDGTVLRGIENQRLS